MIPGDHCFKKEDDMKKIFIYSFVALAVLATASCEKTDFAKNKAAETKSFSTSIIQTRTELDGYVTKWLPSDEISVFNGTESASFTNALTGASASAVFSGTIPDAATYYALYPVPASPADDWTADGPVYTIPAAQTALTDGVAEGLDILYASTTGADLVFEHACAAIKFTIGPSSPSITSIRVEGNKIVGRYRFKANGSQESYSGSSGAVTLSMSGSVFPQGDYYIMIAARNYSAGLTFSFTNDEGKVATVSKAENLTAAKGKVYPMGTVNGLSFKTVPVLGSAYEGGICAYIGADYAIALSLDESSSVDYSGGESWVSGLGSGWTMPTTAQYAQIRTAIAGASFSASSIEDFNAFNTAITSLGGTAIQASTGYWTCSPGSVDNTKVYYYKFFNSAGTKFGTPEESNKTGSRPTRAIKVVSID